MKTNLRTARTILRNAGRHPPELTMRQRDTRERILTHAQTLFAAVGTLTLRVSTVADAVYVSPTTLRRYFADLDDLLTVLLVHHLDTIFAALTAILNTDPDRDAKRRAAYLAATRTTSGALAEAHLLLVRDRHFLPPEERDQIEAYRHEIGTLLAGDRAQLVLPILDNPFATANDIEALLGNLRAIDEPRPAPRLAIPPVPAVEDDVAAAPTNLFTRPPSVFDAIIAAAKHAAETKAGGSEPLPPDPPASLRNGFSHAAEPAPPHCYGS